jgi:MraZ protein
MFRGNTEAKIDDKGRLKFPKVFSDALSPELGNRFFVTSHNGECALIYPIEKWREVEERLAAAPSMNRSVRKFRRNVNFFGQEAELDAAGRILIPALLRERAEVSGEVFVIGHNDHLEVWNRARFDASMAADALDESDYQALEPYRL